VTIVQIGALVAFVTKPLSMNWAPFHLCKSKLYTNTLLAMLNSRTQAEGMAPRTGYFEHSLPLQEVSNGETAHQVHDKIPDRIQAWESAGVDWDAHPVPVAPEKHTRVVDSDGAGDRVVDEGTRYV